MNAAGDLVTALLDRVGDDDARHERVIAAELVARLGVDDLRTVAAGAIERAIWSRRRQRQAEIEQDAADARMVAREAERQAERQAQGAQRFDRLLADPALMYGPIHRGSVWLNSNERTQFRRWAGDRFDAWHQRASAVVQTDPGVAETFAEDWHPGGVRARQREVLARRVTKIIEDAAAEIELRVTQELLDSVFALGDGRRTTWGQATVTDHEQRIDLLLGNAAANADSAARHMAAVTLLRRRGVDTLADVAARKAAA